MQIIKYFFVLFAASALLWPTQWSADKYIYPIVWIVILWIGMAMRHGDCNQVNASNGSRRACTLATRWVQIPLAILLLSNAIYIGKTAIKQIGDNIKYAQGDRYAGYPPTVKQMFLDFERARELPAGVRITCRKPELLFITSGRASDYPPGVVR